MQCLICLEQFQNAKKLATHLQSIHNISSKEYTIKHLGFNPICKLCSNETRYSSFMFKTYCCEHSFVAESLGGNMGGKKKITWNKGQTAKTNVVLAKQASDMLGAKNHFFGKTHTNETKNKISKTKTLDKNDVISRISQRETFELITPIDSYFSRQGQHLTFMCNVCGSEQEKTLQAYERGSRCYKCFPIKSQAELELYDFVKQHKSDALSGDRTLIAPKELDIYVPSAKLAIEYHGLYHHSDNGLNESFDKFSHQFKHDICVSHNTQLVQIFQDEWRDKKDICKSMLLHRLKVKTKNIHARKCSIHELTSLQQREFFNCSHIAGYSPASVAFGLKYDGVIIGAISLRKPRQKKYCDVIEVARFATLPFHSISGGLSKLINVCLKFCKENKIKSLMTYVDTRFGNGKGYETCGFSVINRTGLTYWYTDNVNRYDRFKFRASSGLSEKQIALNNGVSKIYGCDNIVLELQVI